MSLSTKSLEPTFPHKSPLWVTYYTSQIVFLCTMYFDDTMVDSEDVLIKFLGEFSSKAGFFLFPESFLIYWVPALNALDTIMSKIISSNTIQEKSPLLLTIMEFEHCLLDIISPTHIVYSSIDRIIDIIKSPETSSELLISSLRVAIAATKNKKKSQVIPHSKDLLSFLESIHIPLSGDSLPSDSQLLIFTTILQLIGDKKAKKLLNSVSTTFESSLIDMAHKNSDALFLLNVIMKIRGKLLSTSKIISPSFLQCLFIDPFFSYRFLSTLALYPLGSKKLLDNGFIQLTFETLGDKQAPIGTKTVLLSVLLKLLKKSPDQFFSLFNEYDGISRLVPYVSKEKDLNLKLILKLILNLIQRFPTQERINTFPEGPFPILLSKIIDLAAKLPPYNYPVVDIIQEAQVISSEFLISNALLALEIITTWIHAEPTSLSILQEYKITNRILDSILIGDFKVSAHIIEALPAVLTAFSLNNDGLFSIESKYLEFIESKLSEAIIPDRSIPILIDPDSIGEALDELARHQPTLRRVITNTLIMAIKRIPSLIGATETSCPLPKCQYPRRTAFSDSDLSPFINIPESEIEQEKGGPEHEHIAGGWSEAVESISIIIELFITTKAHHDLFCELEGISILIQSIFDENQFPLNHGPDFDFCIGAEAYSFSFLLRHFSNSAPKKFTESFFPTITDIIQSSLFVLKSSAILKDKFRAMTLLSVALRSLCDLWISDRSKLSTLHPTILDATLLFFKKQYSFVFEIIPLLIEMHWKARKEIPYTFSEKKNNNVILFLSSQLVSMSVVALSIYSRLLLENPEEKTETSALIECVNAHLILSDDCSSFFLYKLTLLFRIARTIIIDDILMTKSFTSYSISTLIPNLTTCIKWLIDHLENSTVVFPSQAALSGAHDKDSIWKGMDESHLLGRTFMDSLELLAGILLISSTSNMNLCVESLVEELMKIFHRVPEGAQLLIIQIFKFTSFEFIKKCFIFHLLPALKQNCSSFVLKATISQLLSDYKDITIDSFLDLIDFQCFSCNDNYDATILPIICFGLQAIGHNQTFNQDSFTGLVAVLTNKLSAKVNSKDLSWLLAIYEWLIIEDRLQSLQKICPFHEFSIGESLLEYAEKIIFTNIDESLIYQILRILTLLKLSEAYLHRLIIFLMKTLWIINPSLPLDREAGVSSGKRPQILTASKTIPGSGIQPLIILIFRSLVEEKYSLGPLLALQNIHEMATVDRDPFFISTSSVDSNDFKLTVEPSDVVSGLPSVIKDPKRFFTQLENIQIEKTLDKKLVENHQKLILNGAQLCDAKSKLLIGEIDSSVSFTIIKEFLIETNLSSWKVSSTLSILSELFISYHPSIIPSNVNDLTRILIFRIKEYDNIGNGNSIAMKLFSSSRIDINEEKDILEGLLECGWISFFFAVLLASPLICDNDPGTRVLDLISSELPLSTLTVALLGRAISLVPRLMLGTFSVDAIVFPDSISNILSRRLSSNCSIASSLSIGSILLTSLSSILHSTTEIECLPIILNTMTRISRFVYPNDDVVDAEAIKSYQKTHLAPEDDNEWTDGESIASSESTDYEASDDDNDKSINGEEDSFDELDEFDSLHHYHHDPMLIDDEMEESGNENESSSSSSMEEEDEMMHQNAPLTRSTAPIERRMDTSISSPSSEEDQDDMNNSDDDDDEDETLGRHQLDGTVDSEDDEHHHHNIINDDDEGEAEGTNQLNQLTAVDPFEQIFPFSEDIIIRSSLNHVLFSSFDDDDGFHAIGQEDSVFPRRRMDRGEAEHLIMDDNNFHFHEDGELVTHEEGFHDDYYDEEHNFDFVHQHHSSRNLEGPLRSPVAALHSMMLEGRKGDDQDSSIPSFSSPSFLLLMALRDKAAQHVMVMLDKKSRKSKPTSIHITSLIPSRITRHMLSEVDPGPILWTLGAYLDPPPSTILHSTSISLIAMLRICSTTARARQLGVFLDAPHDFLQINTGRLLRKGPFNTNDQDNDNLTKRKLWPVLMTTTETITDCIRHIFFKEPSTPPLLDAVQNLPVPYVSIDVAPEEDSWMSVDEEEAGNSYNSSDENAQRSEVNNSENNISSDNVSQVSDSSAEDGSQVGSPSEVDSSGDNSNEQWPVLYVTPQLDTEVLEALPEDMQREILSSYFYERRQNNPGALLLEVTPEFLDSIENLAIRSLIIEIQQEERQQHLRVWQRQQRDGLSTSAPLISPSTGIPPTLQEALGSLFAAAGLFREQVSTFSSRHHRSNTRGNEDEVDEDEDVDVDVDVEDEPDNLIDSDEEMVVDQEDGSNFRMIPSLRRGHRRTTGPAPFFVAHRFASSSRRRPSPALFPMYIEVSDDYQKPSSPSISEHVLCSVLDSMFRFPSLYRLHRTFLGVVMKKNVIALTLVSILNRLQSKEKDNFTEDQSLVATLEWLLNRSSYGNEESFYKRLHVGDAVASAVNRSLHHKDYNMSRMLLKGFRLLTELQRLGWCMLSSEILSSLIPLFLTENRSESILQSFFTFIQRFNGNEDDEKERVKGDRELHEIALHQCTNELGKLLDLVVQNAQVSSRLLIAARIFQVIASPEVRAKDYDTTVDLLFKRDSYFTLWSLVDKHLEEKVDPTSSLALIFQALIILASIDQNPLPLELPSDEKKLLGFAVRHRLSLNTMIRARPSLLIGNDAKHPVPLQFIAKAPPVSIREILDFENKRMFLARSLPRNQGSILSLRVRREHVFEDSFHEIMSLSGSSFASRRLSIIFEEEAGIDAGGLTREWFSVLAKQMLNANYALFLPAGSGAGSDDSSVAFFPNRLSAVNPEHLLYFEFVGRIIGKALFEGVLLDCHFSSAFYKIVLGNDIKLTIEDLTVVDPAYGRSLTWIADHSESLDDLSLVMATEMDDFGRPKMIDLIPNGSNVPVTAERLQDFISLTVEMRLCKALTSQFDAICKGLFSVVPRDLLRIFAHGELELIISGLPLIDDIEDWRSNTEYATPYTSSSPQIVWFWRTVRSMTPHERAQLLQFVTGSSKVPLGGFSALLGSNGSIQRFSIHKDTAGPHRLPQAHTCFNQLDMPEYDSYEQLRERLMTAIREGTTGFGFA